MTSQHQPSPDHVKRYLVQSDCRHAAENQPIEKKKKRATYRIRRGWGSSHCLLAVIIQTIDMTARPWKDRGLFLSDPFSSFLGVVKYGSKLFYFLSRLQANLYLLELLPRFYLRSRNLNVSPLHPWFSILFPQLTHIAEGVLPPCEFGPHTRTTAITFEDRIVDLVLVHFAESFRMLVEDNIPRPKMDF